MRTPLGAGGTTAAKEFFRKQQVEEQHSTGRVWSTGATALKRKTSQVAKAAEEGMASREQAVIPVIHPPSGEGADSPSPSFDPPEDGDGGTQAPSSSLAQRRGQFLSDTDLEDIDTEHGPIPKVLFVTPRGKPELRSLSPMSVTSEGGLSEDSAASARRNGLEPGGSESREWTITIDPLQHKPAGSRVLRSGGGAGAPNRNNSRQALKRPHLLGRGRGGWT